MKRDPMRDYDRADIEQIIGAPFGLTCDQVLALDFPAPSYHDKAGNPGWTDKAVMGWLPGFHRAMATIEMAQDPGRFDEMIDEIRQLTRGGK